MNFEKPVQNFNKCLDPDLPFYYHTLNHTCFYEGLMPNFSECSTKESRKGSRNGIAIREQPAAFVPRHATMPVRGSLSVRAQFHNIPIELPPLPSAGPEHVFEHSYV